MSTDAQKDVRKRRRYFYRKGYSNRPFSGNQNSIERVDKTKKINTKNNAFKHTDLEEAKAIVQSNKKKEKAEQKEGSDKGRRFAQNRHRRLPNRPFRYRRNTDNQPQRGENNENLPPKPKKPRKNHDGYSLCVSNIGRTVRVRELKDALAEKGIRPNFIVWKGFRGCCYLHYTTKKKNPEDQDAFAIDNIIEKIQALKINPTEDQSLDVKVMDPITRIETVNVTSV